MSIWIWNVFDDMSIYWCTDIFQKSKQWKNMSYIQKIGYLVTCCLWILIAIPITVIGISIAIPIAVLIALGITGLAMFVDLVRGTVDMLKFTNLKLVFLQKILFHKKYLNTIIMKRQSSKYTMVTQNY